MNSLAAVIYTVLLVALAIWYVRKRRDEQAAIRAYEREFDDRVEKKRQELALRPKPDPGPARENSGEEPEDTAELAGLVESLRRPALLLRRVDCHSTSYLGGLPPAHPGFLWPMRCDQPLTFLCCVDLKAAGGLLDWMPTTGFLLFFYDTEECPWGHEDEDQDGWAVIYLNEENHINNPAQTAVERDDMKILPRIQVALEAVEQLPTGDDHAVSHLQLKWPEQHDRLHEMRTLGDGPNPLPQLGGYHCPIQNMGGPPDLDKGQNSHAAPGNPDSNESATWRLLFQMDQDPDLNLELGHKGRLTFWVREADARRGDFSHTRMRLEAYF